MKKYLYLDKKGIAIIEEPNVLQLLKLAGGQPKFPRFEEAKLDATCVNAYDNKCVYVLGNEQVIVLDIESCKQVFPVQQEVETVTKELKWVLGRATA